MLQIIASLNFAKQVFTAGNGTSPIDSLPPSLSRLPEIISRLENIKNGVVLGTDVANGRVAADSAYTSADSNRPVPVSSAAFATSSGAKTEVSSSLPRFYLSMDESIGDFSSDAMPHQPIPNSNAIESPITKPRAIRPTTVRLPTSVSPSDNGQHHHQHLQQPPSFSDTITSPKRAIPFEEDEVDERVSLRELLKASAFMRDAIVSGGDKSGGVGNDVDYDDPYTDETYDSVGDLAFYGFLKCHIC